MPVGVMGWLGVLNLLGVVSTMIAAGPKYSMQLRKESGYRECIVGTDANPGDRGARGLKILAGTLSAMSHYQARARKTSL